MIRVHNSKDTDYLNNMGECVLAAQKCTVRERLNNIYNLELEHTFDDLGRWKAIDGDKIVVASTPQGLQGFRFLNTIKDMTNGRKAQAKHIFFDLEDNMLIDVRPENKNGKEALDIIFAGATNKHNFIAKSDILSLNTAYFIRKDIVQALLADEDNSFLNRWGGELYRDNYTVNMRRKLGVDNGFVVKYARNLTGLIQTRDDSEIVTRVVPVGFDGLMLDGNSPWVDSPLIDIYANVKSRVIKFEDIKVRDEQTAEDEEAFATIEEARQELIKRSKALFEEGIDKPKLTYEIEFADLSKTKEYEGFKFLETVMLGDVVTVQHKKLGIDIKARVIEYEWDCIKNRYNKIILGAFQDNILQSSISAKDKIDAILDKNNKVDTTMLEGMIDLMKVDMKAMHDVAVKHKELAILFEDLEKSSSTYGAMALGTKGFMIAGERTPDGREWDWRTFGTGKGFVADMIVAGYLDAARIKAGTIEADKLTVNAKKEITKGLVTETSFNVEVDRITQTVTTVDGKVNSNTNRITSAEQNLTATSITNKVSSGLNGGTNIKGMATELTKDYFRVKDTNNSARVDISSGNIYTYNPSGRSCLDIVRQSISFYDFVNSTRNVGVIGSSHNTGDSNKWNIIINTNLNGGNGIYLGHQNSSGKVDGIITTTRSGGIGLFDTVDTNAYNFKCSKMNQHDMQFGMNINHLLFKANSVNGQYKSDGTGWLRLNLWNSSTTAVGAGNGQTSGASSYGTIRAATFQTMKAVSLSTENTRLASHYSESVHETISDIGHGKIGEDGECIIFFDNDFLDFADTNTSYFITYETVGRNSTNVKTYEKNNKYFIVGGEVGQEFSYKIECKKIGSNSNRYYRDIAQDHTITNGGLDNIQSLKDESAEKEARTGVLKYIETLVGIKNIEQIEQLKELKESNPAMRMASELTEIKKMEELESE